MNRLAQLAVIHPRRVLAGWVLFVAVFAFLGQGVGGKLLPTQLNVPGTNQYRAFQLAHGHFPDQEAAVLLEGPPQALERQGAALTRALALRAGTVAVSPWIEGGGASTQTLRPRPDQALIAIGITVPRGQTAATVVAPLERFIRARVSPPVRSSISGTAVVQADLNHTLVRSIEHAELLAYPILLIVLLLVFGSPVAAAVPLVMGASTVYAGFGVLDVIASHFAVDAVAYNMCSMVGLAVGVDYSLLIVTRFREALHEGQSVHPAALIAGRRAGGTAVFAGATLLGIMLVTIVLSPGSVLLSGALGAIIVTALGMAGAALVTPAWMCLIGTRIDAGALSLGRLWPARKPAPALAPGPGPIGRGVRRVARHPAWAAASVLLVIGLLAAPVLAMQTIPPDPRTLPPDDPALQAFKRVRAAGFGPAISIVIDSRGGSLTGASRLSEIEGFEQRLAGLRFAKSVIGPGMLEPAAAQLQSTPNALRRVGGEVRDGAKRLNTLQHGLTHAGAGVGELRAGLRSAASGAQRLSGATAARALPGSRALASGAQRAAAGAGQLTGGQARAHTGAGRIAAGAASLSRSLEGRLAPGADRLAGGLREGAAKLRMLRLPAQATEAGLRKAWDALLGMTVGKTDPLYLKAVASVGVALGAITGRSPTGGPAPVAAYQGMDASLATASQQAGEAADGAQRIASGAHEAAHGGKRLSQAAARLQEGLQRLLSGDRRLQGGLARVQGGAEGLATGLVRIQGAQLALAHGLSGGSQRSAQLQRGLLSGAASVGAFRARLEGPGGGFGQLRRFDELQARSPGFFSSGYLTVAALDGAPAFANATSRYLVDARGGGSFARVVLLPSVPPNDPRTASVVDQAVTAAGEFQRSSGMRVAVGGAATQLVDYKRVVSGRLPLLVISIALVTYLFLVVILRSLLLPAIAVGLNLLTVGAGFGLLTFLFTGSHPLLGSSGALDVVSVGGIFAITFALSIDYQVFLLTRMREELLHSDKPSEAVHTGIDTTGRVVTGAAAIMIAVFFAFALSGFVSVSQFGIGLASAVLIDATIVRLVLLPCLMLLCGKWVWWLPQCLERRLPVFQV